MSFVGSEEKLWSKVASVAADEGLWLYDLERVGSSVLRVTIDRSVPTEKSVTGGDPKGDLVGESPAGVTSGDCTRLCRRLMVFFQAEGPSLGMLPDPEIEVSSPGINRNLRLREHFARAVGERIKVVSHDLSGSAASRFYVGVLQGVEKELIAMHDEQSRADVMLALRDIKRANVEYNFDSRSDK